jgi:hypothetical protein
MALVEGLIAVFHFCNRLFLTSFLLFLPSDDESKLPDVEEANIQDVEETKTQEDNSSDDEQDNTPIAASIVKAPKGKRPATRKRKDQRQKWTYEPVVEGPATYWDGRVEGKRSRTMCTVSYRDEDARSDSEDDPAELFKPQKADESSSAESDNEVIAKKKVSTPPPSPLPPPHPSTTTHP